MSYHCKNHRPYKVTALVQAGWQRTLMGTSRQPIMIAVETPQPAHCQYAHDGYADKDRYCTGCNWLVPAVFRSNRT